MTLSKKLRHIGHNPMTVLRYAEIANVSLVQIEKVVDKYMVNIDPIETPRMCVMDMCRDTQAIRDEDQAIEVRGW